MHPLEKIKSIFEKYTTSYHFYLRDLRTGEEFELGTKKKFPICSCFKLAVLMAYFELDADSNKLSSEYYIDPTNFSPGGGVLNYLTTPIKLSGLQLAQLMISFSDSTSTDILIKEIGLEKINGYLAEFGSSSTVNVDLKEMISSFNQIPGAKELKSGDTYKTFNIEQLTKMGYTNAVDLAELSLKSYNFETTTINQNLYKSCIEIKRSQPRSNLFLNDSVKFFGKTGSLGFGYFTNDCGTLVDRVKQAQLAAFGFCSYGWMIEKDAIEGVCGLIGVEMLNLLDVKPDLNQRWGKVAEKHLLGIIE